VNCRVMLLGGGPSH